MLSEEIAAIEQDMRLLDGVIVAMQSDVKQLQQQLAKATYLMYKVYEHHTLLTWLLAANSFREAYDRYRYFQAFKEYRTIQIQLIKRAKQRIQEKYEELKDLYDKKQQLLRRRASEKERLQKARREQQRLYRRLRRNERRYRQQLKAYRQRLVRIRKEIDRLIREEIRKSRLRKDLIYKLSAVFERNKGKLPWPVPSNKGIITGFFGKQKDASGGIIFNPGIYISTSKGQRVRSVFNGKVTVVSRIAGMGKVVIIQHGRYRTVYANLSQVFVKRGDRVKALQPIGVARTDPKTGETLVHFLIYKGKTAVDPLDWIAKH